MVSNRRQINHWVYMLFIYDSRSSDSTVRMWSIDSSASSEATNPAVGPVLYHTLKEKGNNEIIDLDWSVYHPFDPFIPSQTVKWSFHPVTAVKSSCGQQMAPNSQPWPSTTTLLSTCPLLLIVPKSLSPARFHPFTFTLFHPINKFKRYENFTYSE